MRKPEPNKNILRESNPMKIGQRLIVGEVNSHSQDDPEHVAHNRGTCSILPIAIKNKF